MRKMLLAVVTILILANVAQVALAQTVWFTAVGASAEFKTWGYATMYALPGSPNTRHWTVTNKMAGVDDTARSSTRSQSCSW